ncbi:MAG: hypothetical protein KF716_30845 [Anaerolineae bacterium]|nr:hypothetical protein [Anaerolineae bacterium]
MNMLIPLLGAGIAIVGVVAFWAAIQNWLADLVHRASTQLGPVAHVIQNGLVVLDRMIVNGQRLFTATMKAVFENTETHESVSVEEVKRVNRESLPAEVLSKLESGEMLRYELSVGSMKVQNAPTYRLVVRRSE